MSTKLDTADRLELEHLGGTLPQEVEAWPHPDQPSGKLLDGVDLSVDQLRDLASGRWWIWPAERTVFITDPHADADAWFRSLIAAESIRKTGPADADFELTELGREAVHVLGGDCFDKGPENLRLLRAMRSFQDRGARLVVLAGNHDIRTMVGLSLAGREEPHLAHLFIRMGKKTAPFFHEVYCQEVEPQFDATKYPSDAAVREELFPPESWYRDFPDAVAGRIPEIKIERELRRIREKTVEFEAALNELGMTLPMAYAALQRAREMFLDPAGEFGWYLPHLQIAYRAGSFLMVHAGVDDAVAELLCSGGVDALQTEFRRLLADDLFELYHGAVGNVFRTKYRDGDRPLTRWGLRALQRTGIHAIVHGHRNVRHGQRLTIRRGLLHVECDTSLDSGTRHREEIPGLGASATVFRPDGTLLATSTDAPKIRVLSAASVFPFTAIV